MHHVLVKRGPVLIAKGQDGLLHFLQFRAEQIVRALRSRRIPAFPVLILNLNVETVEKPVKQGREDDAGCHEDDEAGVEREARREELPGRSPHLADRPHAAQNHGGV